MNLERKNLLLLAELKNNFKRNGKIKFFNCNIKFMLMNHYNLLQKD